MCTLTEVIRRKLFIIIVLDKIQKAYIDIFKLQALKNDPHIDFQGRRVSFKNISIFMTFNVGSPTSVKSGSNRIGFTFEEDKHEGKYSAFRIVVMKKLKGYFPSTGDVEMIKNLPKTKASLMRGLQHLNIVRLSRSQ